MNHDDYVDVFKLVGMETTNDYIQPEKKYYSSDLPEDWSTIKYQDGEVVSHAVIYRIVGVAME